MNNPRIYVCGEAMFRRNMQTLVTEEVRFLFVSFQFFFSSSSSLLFVFQSGRKISLSTCQLAACVRKSVPRPSRHK